MIGLMVAVIFVCSQELFASPAPLSEVRCLLSLGVAGLVIFLKLGALKNARSNE
jgi:hypothetical protein